MSVFLIRYEYIIRVNGSSTGELNLGFTIFADSHQGKQHVQVMLSPSPGHVVFFFNTSRWSHISHQCLFKDLKQD